MPIAQSADPVIAKDTFLYVKETLPFMLADKVGDLFHVGKLKAAINPIETTRLGATDYKTFTTGLREAGTIDISGYFTATGANFTRFKALFDNKTLANWGIVTEEMTAANIGFTGFVQDVEWGERNTENLLQFTATIKISGAPVSFTEPTT